MGKPNELTIVDKLLLKAHNEELSEKYRLRCWSLAVRWSQKQCQICGSKEKLQAHHMNDKSYHPEERFELDNGVTLCGSNKVDGHACHKTFHINFRGTYRMKCTKEEFEKFCKIALIYLPKDEVQLIAPQE